MRCEPNAMHCTLVEQRKIPALFHPCAEEDKDSPSAIRGSGCVCRRTFYDIEFVLPVVGAHSRTRGRAARTSGATRRTPRWTCAG